MGTGTGYTQSSGQPRPQVFYDWVITSFLGSYNLFCLITFLQPSVGKCFWGIWPYGSFPPSVPTSLSSLTFLPILHTHFPSDQMTLQQTLPIPISGALLTLLLHLGVPLPTPPLTPSSNTCLSFKAQLNTPYSVTDTCFHSSQNFTTSSLKALWELSSPTPSRCLSPRSRSPLCTPQ